MPGRLASPALGRALLYLWRSGGYGSAAGGSGRGPPGHLYSEGVVSDEARAWLDAPALAPSARLATPSARVLSPAAGLVPPAERVVSRAASVIFGKNRVGLAQSGPALVPGRPALAPAARRLLPAARRLLPAARANFRRPARLRALSHTLRQKQPAPRHPLAPPSSSTTELPACRRCVQPSAGLAMSSGSIGTEPRSRVPDLGGSSGRPCPGAARRAAYWASIPVRTASTRGAQYNPRRSTGEAPPAGDQPARSRSSASAGNIG